MFRRIFPGGDSKCAYPKVANVPVGHCGSLSWCNSASLKSVEVLVNKKGSNKLITQKHHKCDYPRIGWACKKSVSAPSGGISSY